MSGVSPKIWKIFFSTILALNTYFYSIFGEIWIFLSKYTISPMFKENSQSFLSKTCDFFYKNRKYPQILKKLSQYWNSFPEYFQIFFWQKWIFLGIISPLCVWEKSDFVKIFNQKLRKTVPIKCTPFS